jgi:N4-gp56 family major capsid protein
MASTTYSTVNSSGSNTIPTLWGDKLIAQAENKTFWKPFEGPEGSSSAIIRKDELTKAAGDTIKTDMVLALTGAGVTGDTNALTGNEEALKFRQLSVSVSDLAHAVRWTEKVEALLNYNTRTTALNQLQKWLAGKLDDGAFTELSGGGTAMPTPNKWFAGSATTVDTITDADGAGRLGLDDISDVKAYAQATLKIEPMMTENGDEYYGFVLHPWAALRLKKTSAWQQAQRDANVRGDNNPLFRGSLGVWDGVILYSSNRIPVANNATPLQYAKNIFFGAQAMARAYAQYPDWREELFDYGRSAGVATTLIKGDKLSVFDLSAAGDASGNQAIGSMVVNTAAVAPTA